MDGERVSDLTAGALDISASTSSHIRVRIGVKPEARHRGGLNLFGRRFGHHSQDLVLCLGYTFAGGAPTVLARQERL